MKCDILLIKSLYGVSNLRLPSATCTEAIMPCAEESDCSFDHVALMARKDLTIEN